MMLEAIVFGLAIWSLLQLLSTNTKEEDNSDVVQLVEIEEVEDSKGNVMYLVYHNGEFLMQDTSKEQLEVKLNLWLKERGARVLDTREAEKDFSGS